MTKMTAPHVLGERYDLTGKRIWIAGHRGMVGSALTRRLSQENCQVLTTSRAELDLLRQAEVEHWMQEVKPHAVIIAAAKVGGIHANDSKPAEFIHQNLTIANNIIHSAHLAGVEKLLNLGSSCIYPRLAAQPIAEGELLTGPLEPTNEWYAIAKIAAIKLCAAYRRQYRCDFISAMPTNLYGPGDNFDLDTSHVLPALLRKAHEAKTVGASTLTVWGSGKPLREFMHVDDLADALVFLLREYSAEEHINVGSGEEISIGDLVETISQTVQFRGAVTYDTSKPDGTPRKLMDSTRLLAMGWRPQVKLSRGIADLYRDLTSDPDGVFDWATSFERF